MKIDVAYLCDGKQCEKCSEERSHTLDIAHAKHKDDLLGRVFRCIRNDNGVIGFFEVEKPEHEFEWHDNSEWEQGYNACLDAIFYKD